MHSFGKQGTLWVAGRVPCGRPRAAWIRRRRPGGDVLQRDGQELRAEPYEQRRTVPRGLFTGHGLPQRWTLS
ncbi:hypothetical protein GCM10010271_71340 [Streptomyces kurssanovii]|nr:hypothetical protein GCM10010271_71340 [Streptomyces kurssanovii]